MVYGDRIVAGAVSRNSKPAIKPVENPIVETVDEPTKEMPVRRKGRKKNAD